MSGGAIPLGDPLAAFLDTRSWAQRNHRADLEPTMGAQGEPVTLLALTYGWNQATGETAAGVIVRQDGRLELAPLEDLTVANPAEIRARAVARAEGRAR